MSLFHAQINPILISIYLFPPQTLPPNNTKGSLWQKDTLMPVILPTSKYPLDTKPVAVNPNA